MRSLDAGKSWPEISISYPNVLNNLYVVIFTRFGRKCESNWKDNHEMYFRNNRNFI